jgi:hypothetical protein
VTPAGAGIEALVQPGEGMGYTVAWIGPWSSATFSRVPQMYPPKLPAYAALYRNRLFNVTAGGGCGGFSLAERPMGPEIANLLAGLGAFEAPNSTTHP